MEFEKQLQGLMTLEDPGVAFTETVLAGTRDRVNWISRKRRRVIFIGAFLVLAAAAAIFATWSTSSSPDVVALRSPVAVRTSVDTVAAGQSPGPEAAEQKSSIVSAGYEEPPVEPFNVVVLPLKLDEMPANGKAAVNSMYGIFLELLRETPGVRLVDDGGENAREGKFEYRITVQGRAQTPDGKLPITMETEILKGPSRSQFMTSSMLETAPRCVSPSPVPDLQGIAIICPDGTGTAAGLVRVLRKLVFPPDPSLGRQFKAQLSDRSLDAQLRMQALMDLASMGWAHYGFSAGNPFATKALHDPAVISAAVDLAATAADAAVRAKVWALLRGTGNVDLIPPLLAALGQDPAGDVRLAALTTLSGEFSEDPRVRAAFVEVARRDTRPLVRALAIRASSGANGDAAWREYIRVSLEDPGRTALQRIEALFFDMNVSMTAAAQVGSVSSDLRRPLSMLDRDEIRSLTQVLPIAAADPSFLKSSLYTVVGALGQIDDPAVTDMLLASVERDGLWLDRTFALETLGSLASRRNDPKVRAALERISVNDANPKVRQIATSSLAGSAWGRNPDPNAVGGGSPANAGAATPQRLGVIYSPVEPANVPNDLAGKVQVTRVGPGTVADKAGVQEGDVLLALNGVEITASEVTRVVEGAPKGVDLDLLVRRGGTTLNLRARF